MSALILKTLALISPLLLGSFLLFPPACADFRFRSGLLSRTLRDGRSVYVRRKGGKEGRRREMENSRPQEEEEEEDDGGPTEGGKKAGETSHVPMPQTEKGIHPTSRKRTIRPSQT